MDNKEKLLEEALKLFAGRGIDAVGVQEIATVCDVTKPTLYHYFSSKEGLVQALLNKGFLQLNAELDNAGTYDGDIREHLKKIGEVWMRAVTRLSDFFRVQFSLVFLSGDQEAKNTVKSAHAALQKRMEEVFIASAVQNGNMKGRHRELAAHWLGLLNHWAGLYLNGWTDADSEFYKASLRQFLYGIFS